MRIYELMLALFTMIKLQRNMTKGRGENKT